VSRVAEKAGAPPNGRDQDGKDADLPRPSAMMGVLAHVAVPKCTMVDIQPQGTDREDDARSISSRRAHPSALPPLPPTRRGGS
jgi:hypothetical protein